MDLGALNKKGTFEVEVAQGENLGFCFPVHRFTTPPLVVDFVAKVKFVVADGSPFKPGYVFCVANYALLPGKTTQVFEKQLLESKGYVVDAVFTVKSGNNCTFLFSPPEGEKKQRVLDAASVANERIANYVAQKSAVRQEHGNPIGALLTKVTSGHKGGSSTDPFFIIEDKCIGCGACESICPTNSIAMINGKPQWSGSECAECLACLHFCPTQASQHGKSTVKRGRYINPVVDEFKEA